MVLTGSLTIQSLPCTGASWDLTGGCPPQSEVPPICLTVRGLKQGWIGYPPLQMQNMPIMNQHVGSSNARAPLRLIPPRLNLDHTRITGLGLWLSFLIPEPLDPPKSTCA